MLPYTENAFKSYFNREGIVEIKSSDIWYEERTDFSVNAVGQERVSHKEKYGYELLQGNDYFEGRLLGGCLESLYRILEEESIKSNIEYNIFPREEEWENKILFIETSEEKPNPEKYRDMLLKLKEKNIFNKINGIIVGKPQDEKYYEEYKSVLIDVIDNNKLPILYNVNFGHAYPRTVLPYGAMAKVDFKNKVINIEENS